MIMTKPMTIENAEKLKDGECDTYENKDGNIVVLYESRKR